MASSSTVDEYLAALPADARASLEQLRRTVQSAVPEATETISYQMPTFKYRGKALLGFAAFKDHCSLFPYSKGVMETLRKELSSYDTAAKGATIRFPIDQPPPAGFVKKLVKARIEEIEA